MQSNRYNDEYSAEEYDKAYKAIYTSLTMLNPAQNGKCAYVLGGQPGSGKSTFYSGNESLNEYITIDGDQYRKYHPRYADIVKYDFDNYADRTQPFVNQVVENLINDLSEKGYNIIIEGTLRNPDVPIKTCNLLKEKGYDPQLVVIACDAEASWKSTILRAKLMWEMGEKPRLVPIDKYNAIVNNLPNSLDTIVKQNCFSNINIVNRDNELLYRSGQNSNPSDILKNVLNLENWHQKFNSYAQEYLEQKINIIQRERNLLNEQARVSHTHEQVWSCDSRER